MAINFLPIRWDEQEKTINFELNPEDLTDFQKKSLANFQIEAFRQNWTYLKQHPEIKEIMKLLLQAVLRARPKIKIQDFFAKFVVANYLELSYLSSMNRPKHETSHYHQDEHLHQINIPFSRESRPSSLYKSFRASDYVNVQFHSKKRSTTQKSTDSTQEARLICSSLVTEVVDEACNRDIILQFQQYFGSNRSSIPATNSAFSEF